LPLLTEQSPLIAIPLDAPPSPEDVARVWAAYCAASPYYVRPALLDIGRAYAERCKAVGLDVWLTLGQVAHETGRLTSFWCARPRRNPAGIGVNGQKRRAPDPATPSLWHYNPDTKLYHRGYTYPRWVHDPTLPGDVAAVDAHVSRLLWYAWPGPWNAEHRRILELGRAWTMPAAARGSARTPRELGWAHNRARLKMMGWAYPGWAYGKGVAAHAEALRRLL
jgi:hypothetical protein